MREQKYKDIMNTEEEKIEETLSMTRELKFKDIQEQLDEDKPLKSNQKKTSKNNEGAKNTKPVNSSDYEDIYLTTSFKPLKKRIKLKKVFKIVFIFILLAGITGSFVYFIGLPMYKKYNDSKPKIIFNHTVDFLSNKLTSVVENVYYEKDTIYSDINFNLDSNMESLKILKDYTYGYQIGINPHEKIYEDIAYVKDQNEKHGFHYIEKENNAYIHLSNSENYLNLGKTEEDDEFYNFYKKYLKDLSVDKEESIYVIRKELDIFKEILEPNLITSNKDELEILDETKKVTRNSFTVDKKEATRLNKKYYELVSRDDKLVEILAKMDSQTKEEYLKELEEKLKDDYEEDYKFIINIYTMNGTEFVGFDIEENGFRRIYFYKNKENFSFYANFTKDKECLKGNDCVASNRKIIELTGRKKEDSTEVEVKYNNITYATLKMHSFNKEKISFDYDLKIKDYNLKGDFTLNLNLEKKEYNIDFAIKRNETYARLKLFIGLKGNEQFGRIDEDKVLKYTEETFEKEWNDFGNYLEEKELAEGYVFWYTLNYRPEEIIKSLIPSSSEPNAPEPPAPETDSPENEPSEPNTKEIQSM